MMCSAHMCSAKQMFHESYSIKTFPGFLQFSFRNVIFFVVENDANLRALSEVKSRVVWKIFVAFFKSSFNN